MQQIIWQEIYVLQVLQWKEYNKHLKFNIIFYKDLYMNKWTRLLVPKSRQRPLTSVKVN